jgi:hypothetical protein
MSGYGEALEGLGTTESGQLRHAFEQLGNGCFAVNKSLDVEVRHFLPSPACAERRASCTASENGVTRFSRIPSSPLCSSLGLTPRFICFGISHGNQRRNTLLRAWWACGFSQTQELADKFENPLKDATRYLKCVRVCIAVVAVGYLRSHLKCAALSPSPESQSGH